MDSSDEENLLFLASSIAYLERRRFRKKPKTWVRDFLKKRDLNVGPNSFTNNLLHGYRSFLRMSSEDLESLILKVGPIIRKKDTILRLSVSPKDQLMVTLRYLTTAESYTSLMYWSRISKTRISECIPVVCKAIIQVLREYVKTPASINEWNQISNDFDSCWNFPHCLGALDGKHIQIVKTNSSEYLNYKKSNSIALLALVDAHYNFIYADVRESGKIDGSDWCSTNLSKLFGDNNMNIPSPQPLPGRQQNSPYVIVADDAFTLTKNLLKPYPGVQFTGSPEQIFNNRINTARLVSENAFGILSARFKVFRKPIFLGPEKASLVVLACVHLHNYLMKSNSNKIYAPAYTFDSVNKDNGDIVFGNWRNEVVTMIPLQKVPTQDNMEARAVRDEFKVYFLTDKGSVQWQNT